MRSRSPKIYAPVVVEDTRGKPIGVTWLCEACGHAPERRLQTLVEDVEDLALAATSGLLRTRGERPGSAWLRAPWGQPSRTVHGRSCSLALALASLATYEAAEPRSIVVATGRLEPLQAGKVHRVDNLAEKLEGTLAKLQFPALFLYPVENDEDIADDHRARADAAGLQLIAVGTLAAAATAALSNKKGSSFSPTHVTEIRSRAERLRQDRASARQLLAAAAELDGEADSYGETQIARIVRFHALMLGHHAANMLHWDQPTTRATWRGHTSQASDLAASLRQGLEGLVASHHDTLPPELVAEYRNFSSVATAWQRLDFAGAEDSIQEALVLLGRSTGHHSEFRRLLGTRSQIRWRMAMRLQIGGPTLASMARNKARGAWEDATRAWKLTASDDVMWANDRARTCIYRFVAARALEIVGVAVPDAMENARQGLEEVLGGFYDAGESPALQEPAWALDALYLSWLDNDEPGRVLEHWDRVRDRPNPFDPSRRTLGRGILERRDLPCVPRVCATLAEAALKVGEEDTARRYSQRALHEPARLAPVARWWPMLNANLVPLGSSLVTACQNGLEDVRQPHPEAKGLVDDLLDSGSDSHDARSRLRQWFGEVVRNT